MAQINQDHPSSDESDEDFVPLEEDSKLSEEESNSDNNDDETNEDNDHKGPNKRTKGYKIGKKRRKVESEEKSSNKEEDSESEEDTKKEDKQDIDHLWAEFTSCPKEFPVSEKIKENDTPTPEVKTVTQVYMFAGEQVKIEKRVPVSNGPGRGRRGGGLSGILGGIGKQPKLSILEKSKLDWNQYKQAEGLEEQLSTFNKGRNGYLEKQDFLQRTDKRQFEQEKEFRNVTRKTLR